MPAQHVLVQEDRTVRDVVVAGMSAIVRAGLRGIVERLDGREAAAPPPRRG